MSMSSKKIDFTVDIFFILVALLACTEALVVSSVRSRDLPTGKPKSPKSAARDLLEKHRDELGRVRAWNPWKGLSPLPIGLGAQKGQRVPLGLPVGFLRVFDRPYWNSAE